MASVSAAKSLLAMASTPSSGDKGIAAVRTSPAWLSYSPLPLSACRTAAATGLIQVLDELPKPVTMIVDSHLLPALQLALNVSALAEEGVGALLELSDAPLPAYTSSKSLLYIVRPLPSVVRTCIAQIVGMANRGERKALQCLFCSRRTFVCDKLLADEGLLSERQHVADIPAGEPMQMVVREYDGLELVPLDDDLITLNREDVLYNAMACADNSDLTAVARALAKMQRLYGRFRTIRAKGPLAGAIIDMLLRQHEEETGRAGGDAGAPLSIRAADGATPQRLASLQAGGAAASDTHAYSVTLRSTSSSTEGRLEGGGTASGSADATSDALAGVPAIHTAIILDRTVDYVTPFFTPLTFEAQLDETFGTECGTTTLPTQLFDADTVGAAGGAASASAAVAAARAAARAAGANLLHERTPAEGADHVTLHLNSNTKLYADLRDTHFQTAGPRLRARALEIQTFRDSIMKTQASELRAADLTKFVQQVPGMQAELSLLSVFLTLATLMQQQQDEDAIEDTWQLHCSVVDESGGKAALEKVLLDMVEGVPLHTPLRLLCLLNAVEGGLRHKQLDMVRRTMVAVYGFSMLPVLRSLEVTGLLTEREGGDGLASAFSGSSTAWSTLRRVFQLSASEVNVVEPADIHYTTSAYAPLSVRLVQAALGLFPTPSGSGGGSGGSGASMWESPAIADAMKLLPGPVWTVQQPDARRDAALHQSAAAASEAGAEARKLVLLVYVGGITYTEIAAYRFLADRCPVDFIILTTSVTSSARMLRQFTESEDSALVITAPSRVRVSAPPPPTATSAPPLMAVAVPSRPSGGRAQDASGSGGGGSAGGGSGSGSGSSSGSSTNPFARVLSRAPAPAPAPAPATSTFDAASSNPFANMGTGAPSPAPASRMATSTNPFAGMSAGAPPASRASGGGGGGGNPFG